MQPPTPLDPGMQIGDPRVSVVVRVCLHAALKPATMQVPVGVQEYVYDPPFADGQYVVMLALASSAEVRLLPTGVDRCTFPIHQIVEFTLPAALPDVRNTLQLLGELPFEKA